MGDCSAAASAAEKMMMTVLQKHYFNYDLRRLNGNPNSSKFDIFWEPTITAI